MWFNYNYIISQIFASDKYFTHIVIDNKYFFVANTLRLCGFETDDRNIGISDMFQKLGKLGVIEIPANIDKNQYFYAGKALNCLNIRNYFFEQRIKIFAKVYLGRLQKIGKQIVFAVFNRQIALGAHVVEIRTDLLNDKRKFGLIFLIGNACQTIVQSACQFFIFQRQRK